MNVRIAAALAVILFIAAGAGSTASAQGPTRKYIDPKLPTGTGAPFSGAVMVGDTLYLSGQLGAGANNKPETAELEAKAVLDNGTTLMNVVFIHFDSQGNIILRQDAQSAKLENGYWLLNSVVERAPGEIPAHKSTTQVRTNLKQDFVSERLAQPETIAFYDLSNRIAIAKSFGISTKALETQFHSLLSQPFLLVAMTLIAATVSLKFSRFNQSRSVILGGILSGFVLYVLTVLVKAFGSSGVVPPFVAAWIPVVVALAFGATILLHQEDG